jgi:hypothetical protein
VIDKPKPPFLSVTAQEILEQLIQDYQHQWGFDPGLYLTDFIKHTQRPVDEVEAALRELYAKHLIIHFTGLIHLVEPDQYL